MASALRVSARLSTEFQGDYPTFPVLKSMGWRYFNGTGLVSHYYLPPECTAKKAAELEGLTEGVDYFTNEDDIRAMWSKSIGHGTHREELRVSARLSTEFQGDYPTFPVLKSMGWRYFNGTGLVSHYYLPPECTAKKAAELEGLTEGIHFFTSEDDVKAFWAQKKTTECGIIPGAATFSKASTVENNVLKQGPQNLVLKVVRPSKPHTIDSENRSKVAKGGINHRSTKSLEMSKKMRTLQDITNTSASSSYDNRISAKRKKTDDNNGTDFKVNSSQTEPLAYDSSHFQIFPIQVDDKQLVAFVHDLARNPSSTPLYQTILKSIKIEQGIAFTLVDMGGLWDRLGFIFGHMALSRDMHVCYIDLVFVYNMIRGNGFARKLYMKLEEEAIHRAKSMGAASLTMQIVMKPCLEQSSAFWETMGFAGNTLLMEKYLSWS